MVLLPEVKVKSALILTVRGEEELPEKFASPPYCAVIEFEPLGKDDVVNEAIAFTPFCVWPNAKSCPVPI